jgi:hypothetical protein
MFFDIDSLKESGEFAVYNNSNSGFYLGFLKGNEPIIVENLNRYENKNEAIWIPSRATYGFYFNNDAN